MVKVFLGEDLMETGHAVQVKAMRVECLPSGNDSSIGWLILEEINPVKDVLANANGGHASKLIMLGGQEVGVVDNPVVVAAAVETVFFTQWVCQHLSGRVFLAGAGWGFLPSFLFLGGGVWWGKCLESGWTWFTFLRKSKSTAATLWGTLLVGWLVLVSQLKHLVIGAKDCVQAREGIAVHLFFIPCGSCFWGHGRKW
jgi:hypothetical protein